MSQETLDKTISRITLARISRTTIPPINLDETNARRSRPTSRASLTFYPYQGFSHGSVAHGRSFPDVHKGHRRDHGSSTTLPEISSTDISSTSKCRDNLLPSPVRPMSSKESLGHTHLPGAPESTTSFQSSLSTNDRWKWSTDKCSEHLIWIVFALITHLGYVQAIQGVGFWGQPKFNGSVLGCRSTGLVTEPASGLCVIQNFTDKLRLSPMKHHKTEFGT